MTDSKGFIFYIDNKEVLEILSDEQLGRLLRLLFDFAETKVAKDDIDDAAVNMAYRFITAQMQRDFARYDKKCKRNAENGKKGGRPRKKANGLEETEKSERFSEKAKKAYTNTNINTNTNTDIIINNNNIASASTKQKNPPKKKYGEYKHVLLTDTQYEKLIGDYGEQTVKEYIDKIDQWIQLKGKSPYKDFSLAIRNWIRQDGTSEKEDINDKYAGTRAMQGII